MSTEGRRYVGWGWKAFCSFIPFFQKTNSATFEENVSSSYVENLEYR